MYGIRNTRPSKSGTTKSKPEGNTLGCYPVQNTARYVAPLSHFVRDQLITPVSVLITMNYGPVVTKIDR